MSGGGIGNQNDDDDNQVVIFTFTGKLDPDDVKKWNKAINAQKEKFGNSLVGVTIKGVKNPTPGPAAKSKPK